ncbi:MAG: chromosomal replication initiator protein DnaA [Actinomycetes bacterium]
MTQSSTLDPESLWKQSLEDVVRTVSSPVQRQWLTATRPVGFSDDTVILATPHAFAREWLDTRCGDRIRDALARAAGRQLTVVITVQPKPEPVDLAGQTTPGPTAGVDPAADATGDRSSTDHAAEPHAATGAEHPGNDPGDLDEGDTVARDGREEGRPAVEPPVELRPEHRPAPPSAHRVAPTPVTGQETAAAPHSEPQRRADDRRDGASHPADEAGIAPSASDGPTPSERLAEERHGGSTTPTVPTSETPLEAPGRPPGPVVELPQQRPAHRDGGQPPADDLNPKYSFDDFVIGASNRFAYAAAAAVAEAPAKSYNPLFIYGGAGLGKTHLLHAIGNYVRSLYPRLQVRYVTTEQFTNEFINAIRDDRIPLFQRTYRQADILLVDDIQFLESKERTQEEFFHTFNALHNAEKQIVIASDRPPKQIARLEERLRSRFEWGLTTDVQPPDLETRIAILQKKAEKDDLGVPPNVLELIASKVQSNIRELEGALIRVAAFASLQQAPPDLQMAEMVLKDLFPDDREQEISTSMIMEEVAQYFQLSLDELCSPSRSRQLVNARQIAMYLVREMTDLSLPRIGKAFGGRDHTTVMHANTKIANLMQERRATYDQVQELTNRIKTRARTA